jgi:hypothetical protein
MTDKQRDIETMAERWQRQRPVEFANMTDFMLRLGRIDRECVFKLIDGGVTVFFSDASTYRMNTTRRD